MPRLTLADMPIAPAKFRPSKILPGFESKAAASTEDLRRASFIEKYSFQFSKSERATLAELSAHLRSPMEDRITQSCASSVDMRKWRNSWPGWLVAHCAEHSTAPVFVTLQPRGWALEPQNIPDVSARTLMQRLRNDLNTAGASMVGGGALFGLDSEFEPTSEKFAFHAHGWVWGGMIEVIERIRGSRKYRRDPLALQNGTGAVNPVRCDPVGETPLALATYIAKSFWPERARFQGDDGTSRRARRKQRIKGRHQVDMLLWMHRQRYPNLFLTMKLKITKQGFRSSAEI